MHRQFFRKFSQNPDCIQTYLEESHFILHVVNVFFIIIHNDVVVYLHVFRYE